MGPPPGTLARAATVVAALIALCAPAASAAGEPGFSAPRSLASVDGFAPAPAIAADGRAVVAMTDYSSAGSRVVVVGRSAEGHWTGTRVLRSSKQELFAPAAAFTGDGTAVFAWIRAPRIDVEQLVESRRILPSGARPALQTVSAPGGRALFPQLAGGPGGHALLGWEDGDYALSVGDLTAAGGFGAPQTIFDRREFAYALDHLRDGTTVALSHAFGRGGIQVRLRPPGSDWSQPVTLSGPTTAREATLATGRDGTIAAAWAQHLDEGYRIQVAVRPPGGAFGPARTIAADDGEARAPALAVQRDGTVLVAWLGRAAAGILPRADEVRLASVSAGGTVSSLGGVSGGPGRISTAPQLALDGEDDSLLSWEEGRRLLSASRPSGGVLSAARPVSPAGVRVVGSQVVTNQRGDALATWAVDSPRQAVPVIQVAEATF